MEDRDLALLQEMHASTKKEIKDLSVNVKKAGALVRRLWSTYDRTLLGDKLLDAFERTPAARYRYRAQIELAQRKYAHMKNNITALHGKEKLIKESFKNDALHPSLIPFGWKQNIRSNQSTFNQAKIDIDYAQKEFDKMLNLYLD